MKEIEVEVTLLEIKNLYEYFFAAYRQPGFNLEWSKVTIKNLKYLEKPVTIQLVKLLIKLQEL